MKFIVSCKIIEGGSVIRMLASFLGDETFRKGITRYLNAAYVCIV